jgi:hypothetical protein
MPIDVRFKMFDVRLLNTPALRKGQFAKVKENRWYLSGTVKVCREKNIKCGMANIL